MVDLESVLQKEGTATAKRLLEQYQNNFVEKYELQGLSKKAKETRDYLQKNGLEDLALQLNLALHKDSFYEDDFYEAKLIETDALTKIFEDWYGVVCPAVSVSFPEERWGNKLSHRIKSFFKFRKTIIKKLGYPQDILSLVRYYGFYVDGNMFKPHRNLFLNETGLSLLEDGTGVISNWEHETLHAAYKHHSKTSFYNISQNMRKDLGMQEKADIGDAVMDMSLLDELNARRGSGDVYNMIIESNVLGGTTGYLYLVYAIGKYNKFASENDIQELTKEDIPRILEKKELQMRWAVSVIQRISQKITQAQLTKILYTCAPTKQELDSGRCHSPLEDIVEWGRIVENRC